MYETIKKTTNISEINAKQLTSTPTPFPWLCQFGVRIAVWLGYDIAGETTNKYHTNSWPHFIKYAVELYSNG